MTSYWGAKSLASSTPRLLDGRSRTWPTLACTMYCGPRNFLMVFTLAGDSTMISCLPMMSLVHPTAGAVAELSEKKTVLRTVYAARRPPGKGKGRGGRAGPPDQRQAAAGLPCARRIRQNAATSSPLRRRTGFGRPFSAVWTGLPDWATTYKDRDPPSPQGAAMHPHRILSLLFLLLLSLALGACASHEARPAPEPGAPCPPSPWSGATGSSSPSRTARA